MELSGLARKFTNFMPRFSSADFSGMLEILGAALGCYSVFGELKTSWMMLGNDLAVRALGNFDDPASASDRTVFIPRVVSSSGFAGAFSALVAAANGTGALVATDIVHVDANSNAPVVMMAEDATIAMGCYEGIRILLSIMDESSAGAMGAYAVTRGFHRALTVAGHTDEGGVMRSVLRARAFGTSYGGVYMGQS